MRPMQMLPVLLVLSVFVAASSFAGDELAIHLHFMAAKQDCPLQITGFRLSKPSKGRPASPEVLLHNTTGQLIQFFYIHGLIGDPRAIDAAGPKFGGAIGQDSRRPPAPLIAPFGDAAFEATFLRPMDSTSNVKNLARSCLQIAVAVTYVAFSDRETWSINWKDFRTLWANSIQPESVQGCTQVEEAGDVLKDLLSIVVSERTPAQLSSVPVKSYSLECPLQRTNGAETAVCDW